MQDKAKIMVKIENLGRNVYCDYGATLLECLNQNKVEISQVCGGMASCGTCRVYIKSSDIKLHARNELEQDISHDKCFAENERLACQLEIESPVSLDIP